jgi:hypothetical protein
MVKLDNTMVAIYTEIKGRLGANDKIISKVLRFLSGNSKKKK